MAPQSFAFNIAYTLPVNPSPSTPSSSSFLPQQTNGTTAHASPSLTVLTPQELWQGIKRGGRHPHDFAEYVHSCSVLEGGRREFRRRLVLADGAVHTKAGETLDQDVVIAEGLMVEATTIPTGAKSTFLISHDPTSPQIYLTAMYELKLPKIAPKSAEAARIEKEYTQLARGACVDAVESIRRWKREGKLEVWRGEDEREEAA